MPLDRPKQTSPSIDSSDPPQTPPDSCGYGDSREHVGWYFYPRVRTSRRRIFKGTRLSTRTNVPAEPDSKSVPPVAGVAPVPAPKPETDAETGE